MSKRTSWTTVRSILTAFAALAAVASWPATTNAQPDLASAAKAFSQAQQAELAGEWRQAASFYELADSIAPSPEALRGALAARKQAGDFAQAATHALLLQRRHATHEPSRKLAQETLDAAAPNLVRLSVTCTPAPCTLQSNGQALGTEARLEHSFFLEPGKSELVAFFGSRASEPQKLLGVGGEQRTLRFEEPVNGPPPAPSVGVQPVGTAAVSPADAADPSPPPATPADSASSSGGWHPAVAIVGGVITLGLAGVTIWSGVDTLEARDAYEENPTEAGFDDGTQLEVRTNILIGVTSGVGLATILIAAFGTDWGGDSPPGDSAALPSVRVGSEGFALQWHGSF